MWLKRLSGTRGEYLYTWEGLDKMSEKSRYINTDLEIVSPFNLGDLVNVLNERCDLLHGEKEEDGLWHICVEAHGSGITGSPEHSPDRDIEELLKVLETLKDETIAQLKKSEKLDFNVGWYSSEKHHGSKFTVTNALLGRIANIGATLTVTIYPCEENER